MWSYPNFAPLIILALLPYGWWGTVYLLFAWYWQEVEFWSAIDSGIHLCVSFPASRNPCVSMLDFPQPPRRTLCTSLHGVIGCVPTKVRRQTCPPRRSSPHGGRNNFLPLRRQHEPLLARRIPGIPARHCRDNYRICHREVSRTAVLISFD